MAVFLLIVIAAVLLFGAAAVRNAIGVVAGLVLGAIGLAMAISAAGRVPGWVWAAGGMVLLGGVIALSLNEIRRERRDRTAGYLARGLDAEQAAEALKLFGTFGANAAEDFVVRIEQNGAGAVRPESIPVPDLPRTDTSGQRLHSWRNRETS